MAVRIVAAIFQVTKLRIIPSDAAGMFITDGGTHIPEDVVSSSR
jgi:hypothetical protein